LEHSVLCSLLGQYRSSLIQQRDAGRRSPLVRLELESGMFGDWIVKMAFALATTNMYVLVMAFFFLWNEDVLFAGLTGLMMLMNDRRYFRSDWTWQAAAYILAFDC
jgi:hypothetical protein